MTLQMAAGEGRGYPAIGAPADGGAIDVVTSVDDVLRMRDRWRSYPIADIDSDIDYFLTVIAHAKNVISPFVVRLEQPGCPDLVAIARLENLPLRYKIGYRTLGSTTLRAVVTTFGGVLGGGGVAGEKRLMNHLNAILKNGLADVVVLRNVDIGTSLHGVAIASAGSRLRVVSTAPTQRWEVDIPDTMEAFLGRRSSRTRNAQRRAARNLRDEFADGLVLRRFDQPSEFAELGRDMEAVASVSYQRGLGAGFTGSEMQMALIKLGLATARFRVWMLYLHDKPVAFWGGFIQAGTLHIMSPAFDPAYAARSVGAFTMLAMIEDLCADPSISRLDFGHGEAEYKSAFGQCSHLECDVILAAPRVRPMLALAAFRIATAAEAYGREAVEKFAWAKALKRRMRKGKNTAG
jgi:CelD/BcsL family acetyltransferase involved in cellulose biosynthesis